MRVSLWLLPSGPDQFGEALARADPSRHIYAVMQANARAIGP